MAIALASGASGCSWVARATTNDAPSEHVARVRDASGLDVEALRALPSESPSLLRWRREADAGDVARGEALRRALAHLLVVARARAANDPMQASADLALAERLSGCAASDAACMESRLDESDPSKAAMAAWYAMPLGDAQGTYANAVRAVLLAESLGARHEDGTPAEAHVWTQLHPGSEAPRSTREAWPLLEAATRSADEVGDPWGAADLRAAIEPVRARLDASSVVIPRPPSALEDLTLRVARCFDEDDLHRVEAMPRLLVIRSTGIALLAEQRYRWRDGGEVLEPEDATLELLAFEGPGMVPVDALQGDRLPELGEALPPVDEATDEASSVTGVVADGSVYFTTARPVLVELARAGHSARLLQRSAHADAWTGLPLTLVPETTPVRHALLVRADGYFFAPYDPSAMSELQAFARVDAEPLLALYTYLSEAIDDGRIDPEEPLTVVVEDPTVDIGILSHLANALAWRRTHGALSDASLLRSPAQRDVAGLPVPLFSGGLRLAY